MNLLSPTIKSSPAISKKYWAGALLLGTLLWLTATFASQFLPQVILNLPLVGLTYVLVGVIQLLLAPVAVGLGLRLAQLRLRDIGLTAVEWRSDVLIGSVIAVVFAFLQFLIIIPNTGGAGRSDIVANSAQIGDSIWGVFGFVVLAWTGAFSEELFFRGLFVTTLHNLLGNTRLALFLTIVITVVLFAVGHGYQGWAGVLDTGLYGGLILTLLYLWRGRLTACVVAHALWNTFATVAIYLWY